MPFNISHKTENNFDKIILSDANGTIAAIIPSCSAILHSFSITHNGESINVIHSYESKEDFDKNLTDKGFLGTKLSPFVCRIKNGEYNFGQQHLKIEKFYLRANALHGLLYDQPFVVTETKADDEAAQVSMKYEYRGSDKGYPWRYDCTVTYRLKAGNALEVITTIDNLDEGIIPIQDGWHPYFTLGGMIDDLLFEFQSTDIIEFDAQLIPTGKLSPYEIFGSLKPLGTTEFDNCFKLNFAECQPLCVLRDPVKRIQVEIIPDKSYPFLQLYTPPHRQSIAIENISSAPDAFNNGIGLQTLSSGASATFKTTYKLTSL